ncbi:hypothetical protein EV426DRAFT_619578 [Tirmania nivea]|nr:hypothetical protein EV426DRAFT_619578 [Tirmania nivea]
MDISNNGNNDEDHRPTWFRRTTGAPELKANTLTHLQKEKHQQGEYFIERIWDWKSTGERVPSVGGCSEEEMMTTGVEGTQRDKHVEAVGQARNLQLASWLNFRQEEKKGKKLQQISREKESKLAEEQRQKGMILRPCLEVRDVNATEEDWQRRRATETAKRRKVGIETKTGRVLGSTAQQVPRTRLRKASSDEEEVEEVLPDWIKSMRRVPRAPGSHFRFREEINSREWKGEEGLDAGSALDSGGHGLGLGAHPLSSSPRNVNHKMQQLEPIGSQALDTWHSSTTTPRTRMIDPLEHAESCMAPPGYGGELGGGCKRADPQLNSRSSLGRGECDDI